jgi:hypothetical protein
MICGLHSYYRGACGPSACVFWDLKGYLQAIKQSRPGDWFTLWSVEDLNAEGLLQLRRCNSGVTQEELRGIRDWLSESPTNEFLVAGHAAPNAVPEACFGDADQFEELREIVLRCLPDGEVAVLRLNQVMGGADDWGGGRSIVDAKCPNERGEVPLGGAY